MNNNHIKLDKKTINACIAYFQEKRAEYKAMFNLVKPNNNVAKGFWKNRIEAMDLAIARLEEMKV